MQDKIYDLFLINLPWSDLIEPYVAPAVIKGICESHGYSVKTRDFNIDLLKHICKNNRDEFIDTQDFFISQTTKQHSRQQNIDNFYTFLCEEIEKTNFRFLGISVFSVLTQKSTLLITKMLREKFPKIKIVVGGRGLTVAPHLSVFPFIEGKKRKSQFHEILSENNCFDHMIIGDAEDAIIELLQGTYSQTNEWHIPSDNNLKYPFSNFEDYRLDDYTPIGPLRLPIVSSKGCVRKCDFCDVGFRSHKFQSKDGDSFADELVHLSEKHGITRFVTADSLINGNLKSFKRICERLAEYNENVEDDKKVRWGGNWIARPPGRLPREMFDLMQKAGVNDLSVGAEHGSNRVLDIMNKKVTVEGLLYEVEQFNRVGISLNPNYLIAHWAETYDDFLQSLDMILKLGPYFANYTLQSIQLGGSFMMQEESEAYYQKKLHQIEVGDDNYSFIWYCKTNPNLTIKTRMARLLINYLVCHELNIPTRDPRTNLLTTKNRLIESAEKGQKFIMNFLDKNQYKTCESITHLANWRDMLWQRLGKLFPKTTLQLEVVGKECKGSPNMFIEINGKKVFSDKLSNDSNSFTFVFDNQDNNDIKIGMDNKNKNDTIVDDSGNILYDKSIIFKKIMLDGIDITKNWNFYKNCCNFYINDKKSQTTFDGLYSNGYVSINFFKVFWPYYLKYRDEKKYWHLNKPQDVDTLISEIKKYVDMLEY